MKVIIKTIKNESFQIELITEEPKVLDLKEAIFKEKQIPIETQNLIFKGILLTDDKTLQESKIEENSQIIIMIKKVTIYLKKSNFQNLNVQQAQQPQKQEKPVQAQQSQPIQQAIAQPQPAQQQHPQEKIDQLISMGFLKSDVISALDASNGDQIIATELLLGGMEGLDDLQNMQPDQGGIPQMNNIAQMLQQNPEVIQQLVQQNPQLAQQIEQNPQLLQNLVQQLQNQEGYDDEEDDEENGDDNAMLYENALNQNIDMSLNEQDEQAIQRLMGLGFDRETVVQAYLACMKNEDFAANYLFDDQN